MPTPDKDIQTQNPTELLQSQVILLGEIKQSLFEIQKMQRSIEEKQGKLTQVNVMDIHMSFGAMINFMIKWTIAIIPVTIFLAIVTLVLGIIFFSIIGN